MYFNNAIEVEAPPPNYFPDNYYETTPPNRLTPLPGYPPPNYFTAQGTYDQQYVSPTETITHNDTRQPEPIAQSDPEGFTARIFSDDEIRRGFVKKLYGTLCVQLLVTVGIVCIFTFEENIKAYMRNNIYLLFVAGGILLIVSVAIGFNKKSLRRSPLNLFLLGILTLSVSFFVGTCASYFATLAVMLALAMCAVVCLAITICSIKFDLTKWAGAASIVIFTLLTFAIISIITYRYTWYLHTVYGLIGALVFGLFLAYDTHRIIWMKDGIDPEEYIAASIILYTDFVLVFLIILCLFIGGGGGGAQ